MGETGVGGDERRKYLRISKRFNLQLRLPRNGAGDEAGETVDISPGGVRLRVAREVKPGMALEMVAKGRGYGLSVRGLVAWVEYRAEAKHWEIGVRFVGPSPEEAANLLRIIGEEEPQIQQIDWINRRRFIRVKKSLPMHLHRISEGVDFTVKETVDDVGLGGAAFVTDQEYGVGESYEARIPYAANQPPFEATAVVIHCRRRNDARYLVALSFRDAPQGAVERFARFLFPRG